MKRSYIRAFAGTSGLTALHVVVHAQYQKSRGRKPSLPYDMEFNPQKALLLAMADLKRLRLAPGDDILTYIRGLVAAARLTQSKISRKIYGVKLNITPHTDQEWLIEHWLEITDGIANEYKRFPAYKERLHAEAHEFDRRRQQAIDARKTQEWVDATDLLALGARSAPTEAVAA